MTGRRRWAFPFLIDGPFGSAINILIGPGILHAIMIPRSATNAVNFTLNLWDILVPQGQPVALPFPNGALLFTTSDGMSGGSVMLGPVEVEDCDIPFSNGLVIQGAGGTTSALIVYSSTR